MLINVDLYMPLALSTPKRRRAATKWSTTTSSAAPSPRASRKGHIHLQETLCDDVLALMLAHPSVRAARVSTAKPDVYPDCDAVGVEVFGSSK